MARGLFPALFFIASACSSSSTSAEQALSRVRVSTHSEIAELNPATRQTVSANLRDLVYTYPNRYFRELRRSEHGWLLVPKPGPGPSSADLAAAVRHVRLVSARAVAGGVETTLSGDEEPTLDEFAMALGPYEKESQTADHLVLKRKTPGEPTVIEVQAMTTEDEEWRRFLAKEVDIVPAALPGQLRQLREVPSVRIVPLEEASTAGLIFQTRRGPFANRELRSRVSATIRRRALAFAAVGTAEDAVPIAGSHEIARVGEGKPPLRLVFFKGASHMQRAALVLEQQLLEMGFDVTVHPLMIDELVAAFSEGTFDALLFLGAYEHRYFYLAQSGDQANTSGYSNPEFDRAVANGDDDRAIAILKADVPFTPLFVIREGVAADRRLCDIHPRLTFDLSWLADVRLCAPGETE